MYELGDSISVKLIYDLGDSIKVRRRIYTYVRTEPHTTQDGREVELIVWKSKCRECKASFEVKAVKLAAQAYVNSRCEFCRKTALKSKAQRWAIADYYRKKRNA